MADAARRPSTPEAGTAAASAEAFQERIRKAVGDRRLRQALSVTTGRLAAGRAAAIGSLEHADEVRDAARRIRAHTIAHLDRYLEQFATEAARRGTQVHWAETAEAAQRLVVDIARAEGVSLAVKSKSMVSEEVELNAALEAADIRVVETDLGEYVVQVGDDRPSHIITPIVHQRREDVAALFKAKLGATDEEVRDAAAITAFARRTLREQFLRAGMGISGVNMAVAESGSVCLVTNEGNGRLTTSLPRVHVALMGMERVVPTAADLGVVLQLLARSATGQALSVYTNVITGPRRRPAAVGPGTGRAVNEADGPDRLHVIIVDNGRTGLLGSELAEILYCIRCGACLNVCPVYQQVGGHAYGSVYPGPIGAVVTPHLVPLARAARLLLDLRAQSARRELGPAWLRVGMAAFAGVATRPWLYRLLGRLAGRAAAFASRDGRFGRLPGPLAGWTDYRDFPAPVPVPFLQRRRTTSSSKGGSA